MRKVIVALALLLMACGDVATVQDVLTPSYDRACAPGQVKKGVICPPITPPDTTPPDTTPTVPVLTSMFITPTSATIAVGATLQFSVTALDQNGQAMVVPLTWATDTIVATVSATGLVTGVAAGSTLVVVSSGSIYTTALVDIQAVVPPPSPAPGQLISFSGDNQTGAPGSELIQSISVRLVDSAGVGIDGDTILWNVTAGGGTLNKTFSVTTTEVSRTGWAGARWTLGQSGAQAAVATHKKTGQTVTFNAIVTGTTPTPTPVLTTLAVVPTSTTVQVGATAQLTATARDQNGAVMTVPLTWTSANNAVATVSPTGLVTGASVGSTQVTVSSATLSATTTVNISSIVQQPADTTLKIYIQHGFDSPTMGPFYNAAYPVGATCNFNGVLGQCSASSWITNGRYNILYQRTSPIQSIDQNRSFETPDTLIGWGGAIYVAATFRYNSISAAQRQTIDSAYNYWMATTWADSTGNKRVAAITNQQHEDALKKGFYGARQLGPAGGGLNHWVMNWHARILRFTPAVKYDAALGKCMDTGTSTYNLYSVPQGQLLDRDWRIAMLYKRSSAPMTPDGELTVWVNGVQVAHVTKICTNRDSVLRNFGRVSIGQQYQFQGFYSEMREIDDVVVGKTGN
jgi:uncharacterized protein YjdB